MGILYCYNEEIGYYTYNSVYDYLLDVITEDYINEILDECYEDIEIPIVGTKKMRDIIEAFNYMDYLIKEEIEMKEDEIIGCLEGGDDTYEFMGDILSFNEEKLKAEVEGS
jgi:hypothetical protein